MSAEEQPGPDVASGVAVVVGATGAIGSAVVRRLARRDVPVLAVARTAEALEKLAAEVPGVTTCVADIGDDASVEAIGAAVAGLTVPVRLAVLAAGLPVRGSVETIEPGMLAVGADVKLGGLLRLVRAVGPRLVRGSRLATFAGSLGLEPKATEAAPGAINAGVFNLMRQLSLVLGPRGVTTHTICPGPADTPRLRRIAETVAAERGEPFETVWARYAADTSLGRLPSADEVAWGVTLLLDPEADLLHGSVLYLDCGGHRGIH